MEYNFREIEKKWQQKWVDNKTYKVVEDESKKKFYVLNMFLIRRELDFMLVTRWATLPAIFMLVTNACRAIMY